MATTTPDPAQQRRFAHREITSRDRELSEYAAFIARISDIPFTEGRPRRRERSVHR